jgi:predicted transcriptional regulator
MAKKRRRDRHEIVIEILKKTKLGRNKTQLMREANISFEQVKYYLDLLLKKELLETTEKNRFKTTQKGLEFLEKCRSCYLFKPEDFTEARQNTLISSARCKDQVHSRFGKSKN